MQNIQDKINEYLQVHTNKYYFSGAVLIAQNANIIISKGYGMANYELDVPNTPQTKFRIASITKQFTAMAIMQLQEKDLLNVNDSISKHIPDYPETGKQITIHHFLTHTSGIPNYTSFPDYQETMMIPSSLETTINKFKDKPLEFTPGEKYSYCNSGYILLGYIIEKVSGKPYETYLQEHIFQPLEMKNTGYDHYSQIIKNRASGYYMTGNGSINAAYMDMCNAYSAGALYSTVEDLYLWDRALYTEQIISKTSLDKIFTPFLENYGYGWQISELFNHKFVGHNGEINGFVTSIYRYINDDICIILLSNNGFSMINVITKDLAAIVFNEKYELPKERTAIKVDPKIYDAYIGEYELAPNFIITITRENDQIFAQATAQSKAEIYPESETEYFYTLVYAQITFVKNEKTEVTQLILHQNGQERPAKKIK